MNMKKVMVTGLALGILTSTASLTAGNNADAASQYQHKVQSKTVSYTTTIDGSTSYVQSYLKLSTTSTSNFYQLNEKVKTTLKHEYNVTSLQIKKSKTTQYTVTWKNGKKQTINLKQGSVTPTQKINVNDIKNIDIKVENKKTNYKENSVPYTATIDGATAYVQSYLKLTEKNANNFYQLNQNIKGVLEKEYKLGASQIEKSKAAAYTVTWKNGHKQTISLKQGAALPTQLINIFDIKRIDIDVMSKQEKQVVKSVPYTTTIDGATSFVQSYLKLSNSNANNFYQLNQNIKAALENEYKLSASQVEKSKTAEYTVTWKNGHKQTISLKQGAILPTNVINVQDIKSIDVNVKKGKAKSAVNAVPYAVTLNGNTVFVQSYLHLSNYSASNFHQLNNEVKSVLKHGYRVTDAQIDSAKTAQYTVTWKNGQKQTISLKSDAPLTANKIDIHQIKSIDINVNGVK
ncbi:MAP domain-containing protein [Staphylococcus lutrae]|uniref:MAP domain-containing protein n=1 Tax=Staphylococcus lutrae TaxID=155085 RepID=A0AAC9RUM3_9STAP|nr:MAP domain-containing protein [Staphylococcus lutrae]ARJ50122.1 hypothetical protein B5P37_01540 [Staphylococcus lutrae]PNZ36797.1 hypothetical protein CD134_07485 [Staphylococcus lutrae]